MPPRSLRPPIWISSSSTWNTGGWISSASKHSTRENQQGRNRQARQPAGARAADRPHPDVRALAERGHRQASARHGRVRHHVSGNRKQGAGDTGGAASRYPQLKGSKYPNPVGRRGNGNMPAAWFWGLSRPEYSLRADVWPANPNGELLLFLRIETVEGVKNVEEILSVPGIGVLFVGPNDLSWSLGVPQGSPEHNEAVQTVLSAAMRQKYSSSDHCYRGRRRQPAEAGVQNRIAAERRPRSPDGSDAEAARTVSDLNRTRQVILRCEGRHHEIANARGGINLRDTRVPGCGSSRPRAGQFRRDRRYRNGRVGAVMPGVTVTLANPGTIGGNQVTVTDTRGAYQFPRLVPGATPSQGSSRLPHRHRPGHRC